MPSRTWRWRNGRPRPPGRRWTRGFRRGGTLARRVLVGRRRRRASGAEALRRPATPASRPALPGPLDQPSAPADVVTPPAGADASGGAVASTGAGARPTPGPVRTGSPVHASRASAAPLLPGPRTGAARRRFLLVNVCTLASLALGMGAVFAAEAGAVRFAAGMLLACVVFDGLDGALARRLGVASPFGAQMDSLADMCSFGIATPVVTYLWLSDSQPVAVVAPVCVLFGMCAAIRLARFNVSPPNGSHFSGLPTTIAAGIVVVTALVRPEQGPGGLVVMVGLLAASMVSTFPYVKACTLRRLPLWLWPVGVAAAVFDPAATLPLLLGAYLLSGPLLWARQRWELAV